MATPGLSIQVPVTATSVHVKALLYDVPLRSSVQLTAHGSLFRFQENAVLNASQVSIRVGQYCMQMACG